MKARFALLLACVFVLAVPVAASAHPTQTNSLAQTLGNASAALTRWWPDDGGADVDTTRTCACSASPSGESLRTTSRGFTTGLAIWGDPA